MEKSRNYPLRFFRKKMRLKGYDYSKEGLYFITIACKNKECHFGFILKGKMVLSDFGEIAAEEWIKLKLDSLRKNRVEAGLAPADRNGQTVERKTLFDIIGAYKSLVAKVCLEFHKKKYEDLNLKPLMGNLWQRSFYDKIIRDKASLKSISRYIRNNPTDWTRNQE